APRGTPRRPPARRGGSPARGTGRDLRRLLVLLVVGGCIAVAAAFGVRSTGASPATSTGGAVAPAVPTVAGADTVSATWYCAEGTGAPGGRADETILIANEGDAEARAVVTVMPGGKVGPESRRVAVPRGAQVRGSVSSELQAPAQPGDAGLIVGPRRSRITVPIGNFVRRHAQVALHAHVRAGRIVAERSLTFTAENETRRGLTLSLGAPRPESSWSLPGVVPEDGALHSVLVANFDPAATEVEISPRSEPGPSASPKRVPVGGRSVAAVDLASLAGSEAPFAVDVRATRPSPVV